MNYIITEEHIKEIVLEQSRSTTLFKYAKENGLEFASKMVGGLDNYIRIVYGGDVALFFRNEKTVSPYMIVGDPPVMYIDELVVNMLNLEAPFVSMRKLGNFKYGKATSMPYNVEARLQLTPRESPIKTKLWKVIAVGGNRGFGFGYIDKKDELGVRDRMKIYNQIIEKYGLDKLKSK